MRSLQRLIELLDALGLGDRLLSPRLLRMAREPRCPGLLSGAGKCTLARDTERACTAGVAGPRCLRIRAAGPGLARVAKAPRPVLAS